MQYTRAFGGMKIRTLTYLWILTLHLSCILINAQEHELTGQVVDQESGLPIEDVTVYMNGTTTGTTTDQNGRFSLKDFNLPCELILSHVSYQIQQKHLQDPGKLSNLSFTLEKRFVRLEEATVVTTSTRTVYLEYFKSWFLGENYKEQKAEILNDSILVFSIYDSLQFSVDATAPIVVNLPITGYILKVDLLHFHLLYKEELEAYHCSILGYYLFNPLEPGSRREQRKIARARVNNFYNSSMHFCRSLYHSQLAGNGYVFENACPPRKENAYSKDYRFDIKAEYSTDTYGNEQLVLTHSSCKNFLITYHENARKRPVDLTYLNTERSTFHYSNLSFLADTVRILKTGRIPENTLIFGGSIGEKRIAYMLPDNYIPSMQ
jgi:hypothetical protein